MGWVPQAPRAIIMRTAFEWGSTFAPLWSIQRHIGNPLEPVGCSSKRSSRLKPFKTFLNNSNGLNDWNDWNGRSDKIERERSDIIN